MKATTYKDTKYSILPSIKFRDPILNSFLSEEGGVVLGNMIALAGTSGAGKTTLCKKLQKELPANMKSVFFSLETGKGSVAKQTKRVETGDNALICDDINDYPTWSGFMSDLEKHVPELVIVDSLQHAAKLLTKENEKYKYDNYATIIEDLYDWKERHNTIVILIVQLNSEGKVEGPAGTIFDVDAPLKLIADPKTGERKLEATKNRMGGTVGKPIFYEFTSDDNIIKFFTQDEYMVRKQNVSLPDMITDTVSNYIAAFANHENYDEFKKDFKKGYNKIYNNCDDNFEICTQTINLMKTLTEQYF